MIDAQLYKHLGRERQRKRMINDKFYTTSVKPSYKGADSETRTAIALVRKGWPPDKPI